MCLYYCYYVLHYYFDYYVLLTITITSNIISITTKLIHYNNCLHFSICACHPWRT